MIPSITPRHPGRAAILFGLAAAAIFALMSRVTLTELTTLSGLPPLDLRPMGYTPAEAADLFSALGDAGRHAYLTRQIPLDTAYPALLALTLISTILWLSQRLPYHRTARTGVVLSLTAALGDYAENLGIALMLMRWPVLPDTLVNATSAASMLKAGATTLAMLLILALVAIRLRRALPKRAPSSGAPSAP